MNKSRHYITWATLSRELQALHAMNNSGLCMIWMTRDFVAEDSGYYEQLRVMVDFNDFESLVLGSRFYEQLKVMDDMNDYWSWAQCSRCYE